MEIKKYKIVKKNIGQRFGKCFKAMQVYEVILAENIILFSYALFRLFFLNLKEKIHSFEIYQKNVYF